jgi:hypothetical protein
MNLKRTGRGRGRPPYDQTAKGKEIVERIWYLRSGNGHPPLTWRAVTDTLNAEKLFTTNGKSWLEENVYAFATKRLRRKGK